jgi:hypothetical protein
VLLPSDTQRKPITSITAVLLPFVTYSLTLPLYIYYQYHFLHPQLILVPENAGATFLRNVGKHLPSRRVLPSGIMTRGPLKVKRRFGGICRLHLQDQRSKTSRKQARSKLSGLFFDPEDRGELFLRNDG